MLENLKDGLVNNVWQAVAGRRKESRSAPSAALVVAPSVSGSVGDAALIVGTTEALRAAGYQRVDILTPETEDDWPVSVTPDHTLCLPGLLMRGGRGALMRMAFAMRDYEALYVIGADIIDGIYSHQRALARIRLMQLAAQGGLQTVLVGASISEAPKSACMRALGQLPGSVRINARDPLSAQRMVPWLGRMPSIAPDAAFLIPPPVEREAPEAEAAWLARMEHAGLQPVVVNVNGGQAYKKPALAEAMGRVIDGLLARRCAVMLLPHDSRKPGDEEICRHLAEQRGASVRAYQGPMDPLSIRSVLALVPIVITGRMHVAILGLTTGAVPIAVVYQGKFEGLFQLFDLPVEDLCRQPDAVIADPESLLACYDAAVANLSRHADAVRRALPTVTEAARMNVLAPGSPRSRLSVEAGRPPREPAET
ncbi:polysaccharide pyruvyl transferase family protein [Caenispirillum salinarum]|uniref:polysaccharide pyruvyl transferase family protein n=1 Tax=Caenispirillum salinarum TaxID=859058 RepID=UPI0005B77136|nr:polysaccharide pyruvyl transferase family protein [Caenispirillum salinarum]